MSKNEKKTENLSRRLLRKVGIFDNPDFIVDEQRSDNPLIQKLLQNASKSGKGIGKPEFIIRKKDDNDFLLVIECKADTKYHQSENKDKYKDYAVDGALLYGSYLSKEFNVISIGISGEDESDVKISTFLFTKKSSDYTELMDENNKQVEQVLSWNRYIDCVKFDPIIAQNKHTNLMKFSRELHDYMRDYAKVTEAQKPLLVSGVLLALMDKGFEVAFNKYEGEELAEETFKAIKKNIEKAELGDTHEAKKKAVINAFSFIAHHPELQKINIKNNESPLLHIIRDLHLHVKPFIIGNQYDFDIIGSFYGEFIRYTGGDGKGLGIILTPKHITDLFADIARLNKNSVVIDICAGTGGFLISAMKKMTEKVTSEEKRNILSHSLIGIEQEPQMFALAVSNMILRGDGKTNLYQGSCFDESIFNKIKGIATAGFINPPYSQKGDNLHELDFILRMLNGLSKNSIGIAIVPMSVAIDTKHPLREKILKEHRLEAVMSMPDDLFYPAGTVTCIIVFTAYVPHDSDDKHLSWFGYWKDDGFRKDKYMGRIPKSPTSWDKIKNEWLNMFLKEEIAGKSVWKKVTKSDEWCAEAYLETDYLNLTQEDFIKDSILFASSSFKNGRSEFAELLLNNKKTSKSKDLFSTKWKAFTIDELFNIKKGERLTKPDRIKGAIPLITAGENNNGISEYISYEEFKDKKKLFKDKITIDMFFNTFYHDYEYFSDDNVHTLIPKNFEINKYQALFFVTVLNKLKYKYAYGRQARLLRIPFEIIKLPVDPKDKINLSFMEEYIKSLPYNSMF